MLKFFLKSKGKKNTFFQNVITPLFYWIKITLRLNRSDEISYWLLDNFTALLHKTKLSRDYLVQFLT